MPTQIDREKLAEWKARLPKRLHVFMTNFFGTCEPWSPEINYLNYLSDIESYGGTAPAYREHSKELIAAFYEITGWRPGKREGS